MRRLPLLLVLTLGAFGPPALADVTGASMSDLEELEKQKDWRDLVNRAPDVPPAQRDARWEKLVEEGAVGLLTRLKADEEEDPLGPMALGDNLRDDFPFLKRSDAFGQKRAEIGLKGLDLCHASFCKESEDKWRQKVLDFSRSDPEHVALGAGKLVMKHQASEQALQEFELAVGEKKKA